MKGLVIWPHSFCRSTFAFYRGLGIAFDCPMLVCMINTTSDLRELVGFSSDEFDDIEQIMVSDEAQAESVLCRYSNYLHLFGAYQNSPKHQRLICKAKEMDVAYGIASEAPCNMEPVLWKRLLKDLYIRTVLPLKVKPYIESARFVLNLSGDESRGMKRLGWRKEKIIPCGYYPPPIIGSSIRERTNRWDSFTILMTGIHQWHRSPIVLLKALKELKSRGVSVQCNITQNGPLLEEMKDYVKRNQLENVNFMGFVSLEKLIELYETCSVFVGTGSHEPWGMRLNDALQCGAPLVVSEGTGGRKLVDDYQCGLVFKRGDAHDLALQLEKLIRDKHLYFEIAENARKAASLVKPELKAIEISKVIKERIPFETNSTLKKENSL